MGGETAMTDREKIVRQVKKASEDVKRWPSYSRNVNLPHHVHLREQAAREQQHAREE